MRRWWRRNVDHVVLALACVIGTIVVLVGLRLVTMPDPCYLARDYRWCQMFYSRGETSENRKTRRIEYDADRVHSD